MEIIDPFVMPRAALQTPDERYTLEVAEDPPVFTNNQRVFSQWDVMLHSIFPAGGPVSGNTTVYIHGRGLRALPTGEPVQCRFGSVQTMATVEITDQLMRCTSPAMVGTNKSLSACASGWKLDSGAGWPAKLES